jgi:hypothetical protein
MRPSDKDESLTWGIGSRLAPERWSCSLGSPLSGPGLFDKKYFDPAPVGFTQDQIQQDGRSFRAQITIKF